MRVEYDTYFHDFSQIESYREQSEISEFETEAYLQEYTAHFTNNLFYIFLSCLCSEKNGKKTVPEGKPICLTQVPKDIKLAN